MSELPYAIKLAVNKYEPIEIDGLRFYPVRVEEFEAFQVARPGIEVMQQALPMSLVSLPLLAALYKLDFDATVNGQQPSGLFSRAVLFLTLALRLGEGLEPEQRTKRFRIVADEHDPSRLKYLRVLLGGEELHDITPVQFARYRPILAAQNGIDLEDDDVNPFLLEADNYLKFKNAPNLVFDVDRMISGVAAFCGADDAEVYDWPILKLERRRKAAERMIDYIICGINEGAGCTWKNGNPVPSLWFDRQKDQMGALKRMDENAASAAKTTVQSAKDAETFIGAQINKNF